MGSDDNDPEKASALQASIAKARETSGRFDVRHRFACVEGVRLHWAELGETGDVAPMAMLHGLNDAYLTWMRVAPLIARDRRVLLLDLPGHGLSDRPDASYQLSWYSRLVARWLDTIGLEQTDLVGHSFGGGVAQMLLFECRKRIRRLVLVAPGGLGRDVAMVLRLASIPGVVELFGQPFMARGTRLVLRAAPNRFRARYIKELSAINARPGAARAFARTVRDIIDWRGQRQSFFQRLDEIAELPPIAICWGDRDAIVPIHHAKRTAKLIEGIVVEQFVGCGHYIHHERPEFFVRSVREFLDAPGVPAARIRTQDERWKLAPVMEARFSRGRKPS
jgi:pimeloyl-ACP methyl ester carboxylesterase